MDYSNAVLENKKSLMIAAKIAAIIRLHCLMTRNNSKSKNKPLAPC